MMKSYFDDVTLLITHYNRSSSLQRLLEALKSLDISFREIVVSDDASQSEHLIALNQMVEQYQFTLVTATTNKGLGNNLNKGQDVIKTPFTLYIQEDFIPTALFLDNFNRGLMFLNERPDLDIIRFYAFSKFPLLKKYKDEFAEMYYSNWNLNHLKFFYYSDHPHLRRSTFYEKFGRFDEGKKGDVTEFNMCLSFIKNKGKGLFFEDYKALFSHSNTYEEPTTMDRVYWRHEQKFYILAARAVYLKFRMMKNTLQLLFYKKRNNI